MGFFDLNVPFERDRSAIAASQDAAGAAASKTGRLKIVVKAMELGYIGVAYNRTVKGVISDADRCKIPPFPLSSLLKVAPAIAAAARFHRELLGVPLSSPFRQYTRLTVAVDSALGAAALHSGNAVLRTYHLVAVRPLNQAAFDQACKVSEVDLIAIDFSLKLPFRLKLPMVKAAIKRGVYFEVNYSPLISDIYTRRQALSNAKLLVDWTRGKNLILSSGTTDINEVRGPCDLINLASLLGLSTERAKEAISGNCRSMLNSALRRKQCYKESIRIEKLTPNRRLDSKEPWFIDCGNWDPISSGEGDLPALDDIAKLLSASGQDPKNFSEINFNAVSDVIQIDNMFNANGDLVSLDHRGKLLPVPSESKPLMLVNEAADEKSLEVMAKDEILLTAAPLELQVDNEVDFSPSSDVARQLSGGEASDPITFENEASIFKNKSDVTYSGDEQLSNIYSLEKIEPSSVDCSVELLTDFEDPVSTGKIKSLGGNNSVPVDTQTDTPLRDLVSDTKSELSSKYEEQAPVNLMEIDHPLFSVKDGVSAFFLPCDMSERLEKDPGTSIYDTASPKDVDKSVFAGEDDRINSSSQTSFPKTFNTKVPDLNIAILLNDSLPSNDILGDMEHDGGVSVADIDSQQEKFKLGESLKQKSRRSGLPLLSRHFMCHLPFKKKVIYPRHSRRKNIGADLSRIYRGDPYKCLMVNAN